MKTRNEILNESVDVLQACYNYYSDVPIRHEVLKAIREALEVRVPPNIETTKWNALAVSKMLDNGDWYEAFRYADGSNTIPAPPHSDISLEGFTDKDVVLIKHIQEGEPEEKPWKCIGQLKDGRWFYLEAGCDYTGWTNGRVVVAYNYDTLMRLGCDQETRRMFSASSGA